MKGLLITFEGTDKSGKETQSNLLVKRLQENFDVKVSRLSFPNYGEKQAIPVETYLKGEFKDLHPKEIASLYALDRAITFREQDIRERLQNGEWFIIDRYVESNLIFQVAKSYLMDKEKNSISDFLLKPSTKSLMSSLTRSEYNYFDMPFPNITLYLHMNLECNRRLQEKELGRENLKGDIHEKDKDLMNIVPKIGLHLSEIFNWWTIYCNNPNESIKSIEEIHEEIVSRVFPYCENFAKKRKVEKCE